MFGIYGIGDILISDLKSVEIECVHNLLDNPGCSSEPEKQIQFDYCVLSEKSTI